MFRQKVREELSNINTSIYTINNAVYESFDRVKSDISTLSQWIQFLHDKALSQDKAIEELRNVLKNQNKVLDDVRLKLSHLPVLKDVVSSLKDEQLKLVKELKGSVDRIGDFDHEMSQLREDLDIKQQKKAQFIPFQQIQQIPVFQEQLQIEKPVSRLKQKALLKVSRESKEFLQQKILDIIHKYGKISALELREMLVDEQGLCSKSSFYRMLSELEAGESLDVVVKGKNKLYLARQIYRREK